MKQFKEYVGEDLEIYESMLSTIKSTATNIVQKVKSLLSTKHGWMYYALALQKMGKLPQGIKINRNAGPTSPIETPTTPQETVPTTPTAAPLDLTQKEEVSSFKNFVEERVPLEHPNPDVANVDADELKDHILRSYRNRDPLFIWGAPGIGKTDIVNQAAKSLGIDCIEFILSMRDPVDFLGLPSVERTTPDEREATGLMGRTVYNPPKDWPVPKLAGTNGPEEKGGILFFDEMNRANPSVLASSLTLLVSGKVGNYKLPSNWVIIAAGNRKEEAPNVTEIEGALANRVDMVNYVPSLKGFEKWSEKRQEEGGKQIDPRILGFLNFKKDFFHYFDPEQQGNLGAGPWPSPRSWAKASKQLTSEREFLDRDLSNEELVNIVKTKVGVSTANELGEYLNLIKTFKVSDFDKILTNPDRVPLPPADDAPKTDAILNAIIYHFVGKTITADQFGNIVKYIIRLDNPEWGQKFITNFFAKHKYLRTDQEALEHLRDFEVHRGESLGHTPGEESKQRVAARKKNFVSQESVGFAEWFKTQK